MLAVAAAFELVVLVWFVTLLPPAFHNADRYRAALPCPAAVTRSDCLAASTELTLEVHAEVGKDPDDRIVVRALGGDGREGIRLHGTEPVLSSVHPGDQVEVVRWEGEPVSVVWSGRRQFAEELPTDGPYMFLAGITGVGLLLAATLSKARRSWRGDTGSAWDRDPSWALTILAAVALMLGLLGVWLQSFTVQLLLEVLVAGLGAVSLRSPRPTPPEPLVPPRPRHARRPAVRLRSVPPGSLVRRRPVR
ncbi:hypothetical protein F7Q99_31590 [Streptomyces kaniharaensis]|uniref:Uncharacterized protein n=1 Tax=Streptomyces kaniharaensis TaxID=212423 RepID=A0A6N7L273_9ACTN|nr:hypothetical protein [Streptomyces kaniharaensis]MQS16608.1 hypothetical protein [Streptomyces kaniharaensis]